MTQETLTNRLPAEVLASKRPKDVCVNSQTRPSLCAGTGRMMSGPKRKGKYEGIDSEALTQKGPSREGSAESSVCKSPNIVARTNINNLGPSLRMRSFPICLPDCRRGRSSHRGSGRKLEEVRVEYVSRRGRAGREKSNTATFEGLSGLKSRCTMSGKSFFCY